MKTINNNNYGCSLVQQENCSQIHGGSSIITAIAHAIGYVARCYAITHDNSPQLYTYSLMH